MRRTAGWIAAAVAGLAALAALALAAAPAGACACGIAIDATVSEESALVIERPGEEEIILSLDLTSDTTDRAAVVVPVPGLPEVTAVESGDPLAYLDVATAPEPTVGATGGGDGAAAPPGVEVIDEQEIGGYQVARLEAGDAAALDAWLADNDYTLPAGAEPILAEYVDEGWRFVAIRLAPEATGRLKPLSISFATDEVVYPMRLAQLGTEPVNITLYTLADGPRTVEFLAPTWEGEVAELSPPPPPDLAGLFPAGEYVTRLEAAGLDPSGFTEDLDVEAASITGVGAEAAAAPVDPEDDDIATGTVILLIAAGVAFAVGLAVATRH